MKIQINGDPAELSAGSTVADAVERAAGKTSGGVAVAVNDDVIPRSAWRTELSEGDRVEVLTAVQGG